jgi:ankyrin repeat protein
MNEKLISAAREGNTKSVIECISNGADVNVADANGNTALLVAARDGHATTVEVLVARGANVNAANFDGNIALVLAAHWGRTGTVEALIARGADVNAADANGNTALLVAARDGHAATVEALIARGADVHAVDANGNTALILAAFGGHTETVEALITRGADVNAANAHGSTALLGAACRCRAEAEMLEALIAKGANVNAANDYGNTALLMAAQFGNISTLAILITSGACTMVVNKNGKTALNLVEEFVRGDERCPLINLLTGGLKALQGICQLRDQKILEAVMGNIPVDLIKLIISFDCDLAFEHFSQYSLNRLKASLIPQMLSLSSANSLNPNTPFITPPFKEETKGHHEAMIVRFSTHSSSSLSNNRVSYLPDAITAESIPQAREDVEETKNAYDVKEAEETTVQDYPVALTAISETLVPSDDDKEFQVRFVMAKSLRKLNDALTVTPPPDLSSSSPAYYAALSSATHVTSTTTTNTVAIVETAEERRGKMDVALKKRGL